MKKQSFMDWWFDGGQEIAEDKLSHLVTKELLQKQPSFPNEDNAYAEALWELAKKAKLHKWELD